MDPHYVMLLVLAVFVIVSVLFVALRKKKNIHAYDEYDEEKKLE